MWKMVVSPLMLLMMVSCNTIAPDSLQGASDFPLVESQVFPISEEVQGLAVSDTWLAIQKAGKLTALDAETQDVLWNLDFSSRTGIDSVFQIINDELVAASSSRIILVDKSGYAKEVALNPSRESVLSLIAASANNLYVIRGPDWTLEAYDTAKNSMLWDTPAGRGGAEVFYDAADEIAYVVTRDYGIRAIDNATGALIWERPGRVLQSAYEAGILYVYEELNGKDKYRFAAIDAENQEELWSNDVVLPPTRSVSELVSLDNLLLANGGPGLIALDKTNGQQAWDLSTGNRFYAPPILVNGTIYARNSYHVIYAVSPRDGSILGSVSSEDLPSFVQRAHSALAGVYQFKDGIAFSTRNAVVTYEP